ncbi:hypothetical protein Clacol_007062 [Clathrus columnatus]|uniref:Uncharacterized protein n=1 Tax=Clathrus columnatus TaxID=1419009 RepID=A0AAV5AGH1_9AGAM|nr:hypothetical protein Clacol_007062 [Clathrus columnatus]
MRRARHDSLVLVEVIDAFHPPSPPLRHMPPGLAYAIKLLQEASNLTITFPIPSDWTKHVEDEIAKYISNIRDSLRDRLRIVQVSASEQNELHLLAFMNGLVPFCTSLFTSAPYRQTNGTVLTSIQQPDICLLDVPVLTLSFASTTAMIHIMGPEELGGKGDVLAKSKLLARETGKPIDEILIKLFVPDKGQITKLIGLPQVYDYECYVKLSVTSFNFFLKHKRRYTRKGLPRELHLFSLYRDCDGVVTTSSYIYERESNDAFKAHYEGNGRSYYAAGPVTPTSAHQPSWDGVKTFLDRMLQEHGGRSVIYVSFGSSFWPLNAEATWKVFEIIQQRQIPMILVHNDGWLRPSFPDSLRVRFEESDSVLITQWAPQNLILGHKLIPFDYTRPTHPTFRIAWPVESDQIMNAMYIGELKHNIGYELLEVLERDESKPLYRGYTPSGTLDAVEKEIQIVLHKAFGPDGAEKRRNAEIFKEKLSHLWDEDGDARLELRRFIQDYLS